MAISTALADFVVLAFFLRSIIAVPRIVDPSNQFLAQYLITSFNKSLLPNHVGVQVHLIGYFGSIMQNSQANVLDVFRKFSGPEGSSRSVNFSQIPWAMLFPALIVQKTFKLGFLPKKLFPYSPLFPFCPY